MDPIDNSVKRAATVFSLPPLDATPCPKARRRAVDDAVSALGFDHIGLLSAHCVDGVLVPIGPIGEALRARWADVYLRERYFELDPRLQMAACSGVPMAWDLPWVRQTTLEDVPCERAQRFVAELEASGVRSGVVFVLRAGPGRERSVVELSSGRADREWLGIDVIAKAMLLGVYALEVALDAAEGSCAGAGESLTEVQAIILRCLQQGMADKLIADRLGMTTYNVDYHLRRLRQRFGARNRVQLAQMARLWLAGKDAGASLHDGHLRRASRTVADFKA